MILRNKTLREGTRAEIATVGFLILTLLIGFVFGSKGLTRCGAWACEDWGGLVVFAA